MHACMCVHSVCTCACTASQVNPSPLSIYPGSLDIRSTMWPPSSLKMLLLRAHLLVNPPSLPARHGLDVEVSHVCLNVTRHDTEQPLGGLMQVQ